MLIYNNADNKNHSMYWISVLYLFHLFCKELNPPYLIWSLLHPYKGGMKSFSSLWKGRWGSESMWCTEVHATRLGTDASSAGSRPLCSTITLCSFSSQNCLLNFALCGAGHGTAPPFSGA